MMVMMLLLMVQLMAAHAKVLKQEWVQQLGDGSNHLTKLALDDKNNMLYTATATARSGRVDKFHSNGTLLWSFIPTERFSRIFDLAVLGKHAYFISCNRDYLA